MDVPDNRALDAVFFRLSISAAEYVDFYRGEVNSVLVTARDGRRVRFPAGALRRFVTAEGIHGEFRLRFDGRGRMAGLDRLGAIPFEGSGSGARPA